MIGVLFFSLLSLAPVSASTGTGIRFSYRDFWFYVSEPTTLDFPSMLFAVQNPSLDPITVVCSYEQIDGFDFNLSFEWTEYQLAPHERKENHYRITVNSTLAVTHLIQILLFTKISASNGSSGLLPGGVIHNKITYYTEETGALLSLNVFDQSLRPRDSTIYINHKGPASTAWTPLRIVNGTHYQGFLPVGSYQVQAYDQETGIYAEELFTLTNETAVDLILQLVGIKIGKLYSYHRYGLLNIQFNLTISNYVEAFEYVEIRTGIYNRLNERLDYVINPQLSLPKVTNFKLLTEFKGLKLNAGAYQIIAQIVTTNNLVLAETRQDVSYTPPTEPNTTIQVLVLFAGALFVGVVMWGTKPQWMSFLEGVKNRLK